MCNESKLGCRFSAKLASFVHARNRLSGEPPAKMLLASASLLIPFMLLAQGPESVVPKPPQPQSRSSTVVKAAARHELTPANLESFFDGVLPLQLQRDDIGGAVIVVVKDGKPILSKGYGFADVEKRVPVSPETTLFRPGSVSKLMTWTAVMQLVEKGDLDLDRDLDEYLDFKIPHPFGRPITLRNLMTHTAGFEEVVKDLEVKTPGELVPLRTFVTTHVPREISPAGTIPAYSNYGANLAGYIVQRVSGQPFEEYVAEHLFKPLDMNHASFLQPLPKDLEQRVSKGYEVASEEAKPFELMSPEPGPDGTMSVTAEDMSHFMIAHLQDGIYGNNRILSDASIRLMHTRQFTVDPALNGMALGFIEQNQNGLRIVGHDGDTAFFHSDLHLVPDAKLGYFVSYNSTGTEADARVALWQAFLDRYFPYAPNSQTTSKDSSENAASLTGLYLSSRRQQTTFLAPLWEFFAEAKVSAGDDGTIEVDQIKGLNGKPKQWKGIGNSQFQEVNGQDKILFRRDQTGRLELMSNDPTIIYQRTHWNQNRTLLVAVGAFAVFAFLLVLLSWPIGAIARRHYQKKLLLNSVQRYFRILARIVSGLALLCVVGFAAIMVMGAGDFTVFSKHLDPWLRLLQIIGWLGGLGTIAGLYSWWALWRANGTGIWAKLFSTAFVLACIGYVWLLANFNIFWLSLSY
jgi:CubicO group peptidase (beta-lactamase class C family)